MIAQIKRTRGADAPHPVTSVLAEIATEEITVELVDPQDEPRWNKLMRKHHYLKEYRMVGESLRYVAKQNGHWIALLGWSSAAFHLRPPRCLDRLDRRPAPSRTPLVACNARFVLLRPKAQSPNLASHLLSLNLQRLSAGLAGTLRPSASPWPKPMSIPNASKAPVTGPPIGSKSA